MTNTADTEKLTDAFNAMGKRLELARSDVSRHDVWLDDTEETHPDWEWTYQTLRRTRRRVTRCLRAYYRLAMAVDTAIDGQPHPFNVAAYNRIGH